MSNRLLVTFIAIQAALIAFYFQQPLTDFFNPHIPTVIDTRRRITYIGSLGCSSKVEHFQNIFYAEEPTGPRRFAPPVPTSPEKGSVIDATREGAWCPQGTGDILPFTSRVTNISENCLSLRIARPRGLNGSERLPVVVYIHGGGHALGSASDILYKPDGLIEKSVADGRPLIYAGINYRLGFFGFATSKAFIEKKETNAGLRDQRAALEWIRDNIEAFGGDPNRVTAVGQSVGASDIGLHLTAFGGEKRVPFQQAMMMSGGPGLNFNSDPSLVSENTASIAREVGCMKSLDGQDAHTLSCLRQQPFEYLTNRSVSAMRAARPPFGEGFFYPTIDNDYLPARPSTLTRSGRFVKGIPLIGSWTTNDGAWYAPPTTATDEDVLSSFGLWLHGLSDRAKKGLLDLYPVSDFEHMVRSNHDGSISPQYYRAAQINRDIWFTCPAIDFTWNYVSHGGVDVSQVRLYEHNATRYTPAFSNMGVPMWRVAHLSDIPYLFNQKTVGGGCDNSRGHLKLGTGFASKVIQFAYGELGNDKNQEWPAAYGKNVDWASRSGEETMPGEMTVQVFGGPYGEMGAGAVKVPRELREDMSEAEKALYWEKLFERCGFINEIRFREEAGV
ncbi:Alpha/Beta hydrolase protein [Aspergillus filifer]